MVDANPISASRRRRLWIYALIAGLVAALLHGTGILSRFDRLVYDLQIEFNRFTPSNEVVIVAVDQASLDKLGHWPWPRRTHGELIERLNDGDAAVIGLDIIMSEADQNNPESDQYLIDAVAAAGNVILPVLPERLGTNALVTEIMPFPELARVTAGYGHIDVEVDADGIARSLFLYGGVGGPVWPHLSLAMLAHRDPAILQNLGIDPSSLQAVRDRPSWQRAEPRLTPFAGGAGTITTYSYADILESNFDVSVFAGKIVLVGAQAAGLGDFVTTPVSGQDQPMSGVEVVANMTDSLAQNIQRQPADRWPAALVIGLLTLVLMRLCQIRQWGALAYLAAPFLLIALASWWFNVTSLWLAPAAAIVTLLLAFPLWLLMAHLRERRLRLAEREQAHATLTSINEGIVVINGDGRISYANPWVLKFTGASADELERRTIEDLFEPSFIDKASRGPRQWRDARGQLLWLRIRVTTPEMTGVNADQSIIVISDVTREYEAERQWRASQQRLRQLEGQIQQAAQRDIMGQVSASIAHEVNQPLTALMTYANACRRLLPVVDEAGNEKLRKSLGKIIEQTERTGNVVRKVRGLFENRELDFEPADLNALVLEAVNLATIGRTKGLVVHKDLAETLPKVTIDAVQIQQVLVNLVRNALDAMAEREDKTIWVRTACRQDKSGLGLSDRISIEIEDDGPGIDAELGAALFDPFVTRKKGGMGIGLSISKAIIEAHHGDLELLPSNGRGARFLISLPQRQSVELQNV